MEPDDILLTDKVAVVTGGGGGIGQGIALGLARFGAHVVIGDIEPVRCDDTAKQIQQLGREAIGVPTDVMDTDQVRALVATAEEQLGQVDILVNNAGGVRGRLFLEQSERSWRRHIDINLVSMLAATAAAAPIMIRGGRGGSIINITSIEGFRAAPTFSVYAACKAGMISFTRTMALELSEHDIRVNCIAPDMTMTPGNHGNRSGPVDPSTWTTMPPEVKAEQSRYIPLGREGVVEECASAAVFLSSKMADYVTGVTMNVDGGTWASSGWSRSPEGGWRLYPGFQSGM
jgi:NAD(P)-dependent dehydrogenase (short-subunit alcohol dehydrogenase family)